ncbi:P-loop NTPase [Sphingomonas mesophila]|uniref:P-loop NTPase n=1 Tax=Sphingomonas mesophila TaxID=2303576 RepID=UPI000E5849E7|nr:P-loop NTPase [Sphingomonas mesophila]
MAEPILTSANFPQAERLRSQRLAGGVLTVVADVGGLNEAGRAAFERDLRSAALAHPEVRDVRVAMTAAKSGPLLVAVGSGKGGVGKSTVAANLAVALARSGLKVGMIDADIYGPSQPTLLGAPRRPEAIDKVLQPVATPFGVSLLSLGQLVPAGQALAWRGPMASGALTQLTEGNWADRDLVVVDLPPGTGDVQLSLIQKSRPAGAVIVSTPQDLSLIDAERAVDLFRRTDVPILGLIENMSGYQCPSCGTVSDPFGQGGAEAGAARMHIPFLGRLPLSASLREASDAGSPPAAGDGPAAEAFAAIAAAARAQLEKIRG